MKPGIYTDLSFEDYLKVPAFSNSWAGYLDECPAILKYNMAFEDRKDTPALKMGRAVHAAVFEPRKFGAPDSEYITCRKFGRTKVEQEAKELFYLQNQGKTVLDEDEMADATEMASAVLSTKSGSSLIAGAEAEVSIFWNCPETNILCKGRMDAWNKKEGVILDLKTMSDSLKEDSLQRVIATRKYYRQLAWYAYGLDLLGHPTELQVLICVQKRKPYPVAFKALSFGAIAQGRREMIELCKKYADCSAKNEWPGMPDQVSTIELPQWAQRDSIVDPTVGINFYTESVHQEMQNGNQQ